MVLIGYNDCHRRVRILIDAETQDRDSFDISQVHWPDGKQSCAEAHATPLMQKAVAGDPSLES